MVVVTAKASFKSGKQSNTAFTSPLWVPARELGTGLVAHCTTSHGTFWNLLEPSNKGLRSMSLLQTEVET